MQTKTLKNERNINSVRNKKVSVLAINKNSAPIKPTKNAVNGSVKDLMVNGKGSNYRHGKELRDSIQNIN